jgi:hypothetical protein
MTANVIVTALGHFLGQLSQKQNWTVLTSTYIQLLVFHCWERIHTVNMETTGSNILSLYEWPKRDTQGNFKAKCKQHTEYISGSLNVTSRLM